MTSENIEPTGQSINREVKENVEPRTLVDQTPEAAKEETTEQDEEIQYAEGSYLYSLTCALMLAVLMMSLDSTIIATAIPRITVEFSSLPDVGWYGSAYLLTQTALMPIFGKLYTFFSIKLIWIVTLLVFELGSIVCATAPNSTAFILGRAIAGIGSSSILSGGTTIIGLTIPLANRAPYMAVILSMIGVSNVVAPLLGGVFTDSPTLTWRFCFWINLPIGALTLAFFVVFFKNPYLKHQKTTLREKVRQMDIIGATLFTAGIVCLFLVLQMGGSRYPWSDSRVWGLLIGFGLFIIAFVALQFRLGERALIPLRILANRTIATSSLFNLLYNQALFVHVFFLPFYFQAILGTSAEQSGIRTIPLLVSVTLFSLVTGNLVPKVGYYLPFVWLGTTLFAVGAGLLTTLQPDTSTGAWIGYQILAGGGYGLAFQMPFIAVHAALSAKDLAVGNALATFFNSLGSALAVSITESVFTNELRLGLADVPGVDPSAIVAAGATGFRSIVPQEKMKGVTAAYTFALQRGFIIAVVLGCLTAAVGFCMEWRSVKPGHSKKKDEEASGDAAVGREPEVEKETAQQDASK